VPATESQQTIIRFGVFDLNPLTGELRKTGHRISLRPQAARLLAILARRQGQILTREELKDEIWGKDTFVDFEHGLNFGIRQIREALGDDADTPRYIETLPRRGYRFIPPVETMAQPSPPASPAAGEPLRTHLA
jgi:DNA-binding winged helix-turn-helix (wHTH) protein